MSSFLNNSAIAAQIPSLDAVAVYHPSESSLLELRGADRTRFLHNQTTNDIEGLRPGQVMETVFVNSTGRTLDLATVYALEDSLLVQVSATRRDFLLNWMERFIFPMDKVSVHDLSTSHTYLALLGNQAQVLLESWQLPQPEATQLAITTEGNETLYITATTGLDLPGYRLIFPKALEPHFHEKLTNAGVANISPAQWEHLRICQGRPAPDSELTEDYNPLEAGLWRAISFTKGCYIGQETIARLNTYQGVKQRLWGIKLQQAVAPGTPMTCQGEKAGILTSISPLDPQLGLAYIKTKVGGAGLQVELENTQAEIQAVSYLSHNYYQPN